MKLANMDPRTVAYLVSTLVPAMMAVSGWAIGCVKVGANRIKASHEAKKLTKNIDKEYEELCKLTKA